MESLDQWVDREYRYAATAMLRSVSAVDIVKTRPGFGQTIRARKGSIVGSPVLGAYDPDPDYFFHWFRDSALVIDALRLSFESGVVPDAPEYFADFVRFNLSLRQLDGRGLVADSSWRTEVAPDFVRYLRDDTDLVQARGDTAIVETRVNPDGTLDISKWPRPQRDGPPLRALALLRWARSAQLPAEIEAGASELIRSDLASIFAHACEPSFDIWEEDFGLHYYVLRVSAAALDEGASWLESQGEQRQAHSYRSQCESLFRRLDDFWLTDEQHYRSRILPSAERSGKELDISMILATIHARAQEAAHSTGDPRMQATLARLENYFAAAYPINRDRSPGPAMGRYPGDVYYSGGPWYLATLGAAEFCYRAASSSEEAAAWIGRGDAYLSTVRTFTPASGELSEQFDARTGAQTSAKDMPWSYAAFISCIAARRRLAAEPGQ